MGKNVLNFPRQLLSALQQAIRAIKGLRGQPDGFVGTDSDGYATTSHLGSGTASSTTVLYGNNTWGASTAALGDGDKGDIVVSSGGTVWTVDTAGGIEYVSTVAQLEAAVAAMTAGIIWAAPGTYDLTSGSTLTFNNPNVALIGSGVNSTYLRQSDVDSDIISIRRGRVTLAGFTVMHGTTTGNGAGSAGFGRGIVIEQPDSFADNITPVWLRELNITNTANWCIFDTGNFAYDVLATPIGNAPTYGHDGDVSTTYTIASVTTTNSKTVTSAALFGNVRVGQIVTGTGIPHNTRVVAKATNSSLTISRNCTAGSSPGTTNLVFSRQTECAISVGLHIDHVDTSFPNSGGCIFIGYGATTTRFTALKTNSYSYGTYTIHNGAGAATDSVDIGAVHIYGVTDAVFDTKCIFQSPSDGVTLPDVDATMLSMHQCNSVSLFAPYFEILSANLTDGDGGADGRDRWFITSINSQATHLWAPFFQAQTINAGVTDEGFPLMIWRTPNDAGAGGNEINFHGGFALNRRLYYNGTTRVATAPAETGDFVTPWDRDDFVLQSPGDGTKGRPVNLEDFEVVNYVGLGRRPPTVPTSAAVANRVAFRIQNNNRNFRFAFWRDNDLTGATTGVDDIRARTNLAHEFKPGMAGYVSGDTGGNGRRQREGLWLSASRDTEFKQVPFIRVHNSYWPTAIAADMWMETSGTTGAANDWLNAELNWYSGGAWKWALWLPRDGAGGSNTMLTGDIVYGSATDTPARLAIGSARKVLMSVSGAPSWQTPDVDVVGNFLTMGAS